MSDTRRSPNSVMTRILPTLVLLAAVLLCAGCTESSSSSPATVPGTAVPSGTATSPAADTCTFDRLVGNADVHFSRGDSCYFSTRTPMDFLNDLRMHPVQPVMVLDVPEDWITLHDVALLMQEIDSTEPAAPVVSPISSYWPFDQTSTVGNEALFLIEGYRTGKYPPALCSLYYFKPDRAGVRSWWNSSGKQGFIDEQDAIRILQDTYPDLSAYPSDGLPPRSVKTEQAPDGWYVAFIQEGSGLPILSARCYYVGNNQTTRLTGMVNQSIMVLPEDFSPKRCR
jgi:hypothetical protein